MTKNSGKRFAGWPIVFIVLGLLDLTVLLSLLLKGKDIGVLSPRGLMAGEQLNLALVAVGIMLIIAVPTLFFFYYFAWKYRETNEKATYDPAQRHGRLFMFSIWAIPSVFMIVLSVIMWPATHRLEPQKTLASNVKPLTIQVVAMRWKWVFIYPEEKIATVNFIQVPIGTPLHFELTADEAPMSSFWIPHLGGQLYAMTGHVNKLNLIADTLGDYEGSSAEINGPGFAGMKFIARAGSKQAYDAWVLESQSTSTVLDPVEYQDLLRPSEDNPAAFYRVTDPNLYSKVVMKYSGSHDHGHDNSQAARE